VLLTTTIMKVTIIALVMEAVSISETLVTFYKITQHNIPQSCHLQENSLYITLLDFNYSSSPHAGS
jgi:hypothetical protein